MWQYRCEVCGRGYINKSSFEKHVKTHETGDQPEGVCCALCGERCAHQYQLLRHRCDALDSRHLLVESVIEGKAGEFKCAVCNKSFNLMNCWKRHMDIHLGMQRFQCPTCGRKYSENRDLQNHIRTHTGERPFKCSWCPHTFHTKGNLQEHELKCKRRKGVLYVCCICGSCFEEKCKLQSHKCGKKQKSSPSQKTKYKCNVCGRSFAFMTSLNKHMRIHTATHPHRCVRCGNVFRSKESFKKHRTKEHVPAESSPLAGSTRRKFVRDDINVGGTKNQNEVKSLCKPYLKTGVTSSSLEGRTKRRDIVGNDVDGTQKLKANGCEHGDGRNNFVGQKVDDLHSSGESIQGEDLYQCPADDKKKMWQYRCEVCGRGYINKSSFEKHVKTHETGDQPEGVRCALCGERCAHQYQLLRHRCDALDSRHRLVESVIEGKAGEFKCAVCNKSFNFMSSWKRHMDIHLGMQRFQCPTCGRKYSENRDLQNHIRTHTGERPFKCSWCPHTFHTKGNLQEHELKCKRRKGVLYVCCICGSCFEEKCELQSHKCGKKQKSSPGQKTKYKCNVCSRSFPFMTALNKHMKNHTLTHPHRCVRCGNVFRSKESFKKHQTKEHVPAESSLLAGSTRRKLVRDDNVGGTKNQNEDKSLLKPYLKTGVTSSSLEGRTKRRDIVGSDVDGTKKLKAKGCEHGDGRNNFVGQKVDDVHSSGESIQGEDLYQCPADDKDVNPVKDATMGASKGDICCSICGEGFVFTSYLNRHRCEALDNELLLKDDAFNKSNHECVACKKRFFYPQSWQRHMIVHLGLQKHQCHVCNKKYFEERDLKDHMKIHTGDEGHKCGWCSKTYYSKATLDRHEKDVHEKGNHCDCGRHFGSIKTFKKHKCMKAYAAPGMKNHAAPYPYHCSICGKSFKTRRNMFTHRKRVHHLSGSQSIVVDDSKMPDISARVDDSCEDNKIQKSGSRVIPHLDMHGVEKDDDISPDIYVVTNVGDLQGNDDCTDMADVSRHCLEERESLPIMNTAEVDDGQESCDNSNMPEDELEDCKKDSRETVAVKALVNDVSSSGESIQGEESYQCSVDGKDLNAVKKETKGMSKGEAKQICCFVCGEGFVGPSYLNRHRCEALDSEMLLNADAFRKNNRECVVCKKKFFYPESWQRHMIVHLGQQNHQCHVCNKKYFAERDLKDHMKIHTGDEGHKCKWCSKTYYSKAGLVRHEKGVHENGHNCECGRHFRSLKTFKKHKCMKNHAAPYPYHCSVRGKSFKSRWNMFTHRRRVMPTCNLGMHCVEKGGDSSPDVYDVTNSRDLQGNDDCTDMPDLNRHCLEESESSPIMNTAEVDDGQESCDNSNMPKDEHEDYKKDSRETVAVKALVNDVSSSGESIQVEKSYQCSVDGKDVIAVKKEKLGMSKGEAKQICCFVCGEGFVGPSYLNRHRCEALNSKMLLNADAFRKNNRECVVCKKKFFYPESWQRHMIVHLGQQKHQCHVCNKKYFEERDLKDHMKIHTGDEGHKCKWCSKSYYSKAGLVRHEKGVHENGHQCDCGRHFRSIATFKKHTCMKNHAAPQPYKCLVCGTGFRRRWALYKHRKRVHPLSGSQQKLSEVSKMPDISVRVHEISGDNKIQEPTSRVMPDMIVHCVEKDADIYVLTKIGDLNGNDDCTNMPDLTEHCPEEIDNSPILNTAEVDDCQELCEDSSMSDFKMNSVEEVYQCFLCDKKLATEDALKTHLEIHCT